MTDDSVDGEGSRSEADEVARKHRGPLQDAVRHQRPLRCFHSAVIACARTVDVAHWSLLFPLTGHPLDIFRDQLHAGDLRSAASCLVLVRQGAQPGVAAGGVEGESQLLLSCALSVAEAWLRARQWRDAWRVLRFALGFERSVMASDEEADDAPACRAALAKMAKAFARETAPDSLLLLRAALWRALRARGRGAGARLAAAGAPATPVTPVTPATPATPVAPAAPFVEAAMVLVECGLLHTGADPVPASFGGLDVAMRQLVMAVLSALRRLTEAELAQVLEGGTPTMHLILRVCGDDQ